MIDAEEFIEQEQERQFQRRVAECVKVQQNQHPQRAVGQGEPPIGSGDDDVVPQIEHAILRGWQRLSRSIRPCGIHSRIRYRTTPILSIVSRRPRRQLSSLHNRRVLYFSEPEPASSSIDDTRLLSANPRASVSKTSLIRRLVVSSRCVTSQMGNCSEGRLGSTFSMPGSASHKTSGQH